MTKQFVIHVNQIIHFTFRDQIKSRNSNKTTYTNNLKIISKEYFELNDRDNNSRLDLRRLHH